MGRMADPNPRAPSPRSDERCLMWILALLSD